MIRHPKDFFRAIQIKAGAEVAPSLGIHLGYIGYIWD
jgi:hypothetical protein